MCKKCNKDEWNEANREKQNKQRDKTRSSRDLRRKTDPNNQKKNRSKRV